MLEGVRIGPHRASRVLASRSAYRAAVVSIVKQGTGLVAAIIICLGAGFIGSPFTRPAIPEWYAALRKPPWTPPSTACAPVWTVLYLVMGVAAWLIWRREGWAGASGALLLFGLQLVLNSTWSAVFFGLRFPGLAFVEIVILWLSILATTLAFWHHSRLASGLLVPYLAWVSYAAALNLALWRLNTG